MALSARVAGRVRASMVLLPGPSVCANEYTPNGGARIAGKFEIYEDQSGQWRFRRKAGNGEPVASGAPYPSKEGARKGCEAVQRAADGAKIEEI